jgi:hypothetical protein
MAAPLLVALTPIRDLEALLRMDWPCSADWRWV